MIASAQCIAEQQTFRILDTIDRARRAADTYGPASRVGAAYGRKNMPVSLTATLQILPMDHRAIACLEPPYARWLRSLPRSHGGVAYGLQGGIGPARLLPNLPACSAAVPATTAMKTGDCSQMKQNAPVRSAPWNAQAIIAWLVVQPLPRPDDPWDEVRLSRRASLRAHKPQPPVEEPEPEPDERAPVEEPDRPDPHSRPERPKR